MQLNKILVTALTAIGVASAIPVFGEVVIVESKTSANTITPDPPYLEITSLGASSVKSTAGGLVGVGSRFTSTVTAPSFKITPTLVSNATYSVEVTLGTATGSNTNSPDLVMGITTSGTSSSTLPATTTAFQRGSGAINKWLMLGNITPSTNMPSVTFTYSSGTIASSSRLYVDSFRFTQLAPTATPQYWDLNGNVSGIGGATGAWDTSATNWNSASDGTATLSAYLAANLSVFGGTPGIVNVDAGGITSDGGLEFDVDGYTIQGGALTLGTGTNLTVALGTDTATINSKISGANGLNKNGLGTLVLGGTNDLTGTVSIALGTLKLGTNQTFTSITGGGALALGSNTLTVGDSTSSSFTGIISDTGAATPGSLVKQGTGTLTLSAGSSYHGKTTINQGIISLNADTALGAAPASATADQLTLNSSTLRGTGAFNFSSKRGITITGNSSIVGVNSPMGVAGGITGSGSLTIPNGWFDFSSNSFAGDLIFTATNNTSIRFNADHSAGNGKIFVSPIGVNQPMTLRNNGSGVVSTLTNDIQLNTGTANLNLDSGSGSAVFTLSGKIDGAAPMFVCPNPNGQGTISLLGDNSAYTGGFTLQGKTLSIGHKNALGAGRFTVSLSSQGNNGTYVLQASTPLAGVNAVTNPVTISVATGFLINGTNSLELAGPITLGTSLEITNNNTGGTIFSGIIDDAGLGRSLTLKGQSTLTLSGANTYTGPTTISEGVVKVNGNTSSSAFSVATGAVLGGSGTVGTVDLSGTIAPGNSPGTLTSANQTWNGGGHYTWEINKVAGISGSNPGWDSLNIVGSLNIAASSGNPFTIDLTSLTLAGAAGDVPDFDNTSNHAWAIATASGGITGFDANAFILNSAGFSNALAGGSFSVTTNATEIILQFTSAAVAQTPTNFISTVAGQGTFQGSPNTSYTIQYTDSLNPVVWQTLTTVNTDGSGAGSFSDPFTPNQPSQRFYRVKNP